MKTKILFTALALLAVLAVSGSKAYASTFKSEKSGGSLERRFTPLFMLKNGIQSWEDRGSSDRSTSLSHSSRESESGDDRGSTSQVNNSSSEDKSFSTLIGTVPEMSTSQTYIGDDSKSSSYEAENESNEDKNDDSSSSHESHSGSVDDSHNDHSSELNDH